VSTTEIEVRLLKIGKISDSVLNKCEVIIDLDGDLGDADRLEGLKVVNPKQQGLHTLL